MRNTFHLTWDQENNTHSSQPKASSLFSEVYVSKNSQNLKSAWRKKNNHFSPEVDDRGIHSRSTQEQGVWANTDTSLCIIAEGVCALIQHACTCRGVWRHVHQNSDHSDDDFYILLLLFYIVSIFNSVYFFTRRMLYYYGMKSYSNQNMWYWQKERHADQWNRNESPEIKPYIYGQLITNRNAKAIQQGERIVSSTNSAETTG